MPTALIITLRPTAAAQVPATLTRATHAWVLAQIRAADPALADHLHADNSLRPFTVSNLRELRGDSAPVQISPDDPATLRVTLLTAALETLAQSWTPATLPPFSVGEATWQVTQVTSDPAADPWAGQQPYDDLAAEVVLAARSPATRWELEFASPVTFRQRGLNQPFPTPDLVFTSLLERWNAFAPLPFPDEVRDFIASAVAVSRFDLRSVAVPIKGGAVHIGAVGRCTYTAVERSDRYVLACLGMLARFAFYSGVGSGATRGQGQARLR